MAESHLQRSDVMKASSKILHLLSFEFGQEDDVDEEILQAPSSKNEIQALESIPYHLCLIHQSVLAKMAFEKSKEKP